MFYFCDISYIDLHLKYKTYKKTETIRKWVIWNTWIKSMLFLFFFLICKHLQNSLILFHYLYPNHISDTPTPSRTKLISTQTFLVLWNHPTCRNMDTLHYSLVFNELPAWWEAGALQHLINMIANWAILYCIHPGLEAHILIKVLILFLSRSFFLVTWPYGFECWWSRKLSRPVAVCCFRDSPPVSAQTL